MAKKGTKKKTKKKGSSEETSPPYESLTLEDAETEFPDFDEDMEFEEMPGGFPDQWDYEKENLLIAQLVQVDVVEVTIGKQTEYRRVGRFKKQDKTTVTVWESAGLKSIFEYAKVLLGHWFKIEFKGCVKLKGRKQQMKDYAVSVDRTGREALLEAMKRDA